MSYGQKKKLLLSFGIATNTEVLLMDEPTNGLDIPSKSTFRKLIAKYMNENRIFIISTHQVKDIEGMIDNIVIINEGKIIFNQNIENISKKLAFKQVNNIDNEDILYSQKQGGGYNIISTNNKEFFESKIDTELLFNAVIENNTKIINLFKSNNNE
jgi:ABC-2 type transport system ATP-binding protein